MKKVYDKEKQLVKQSSLRAQIYHCKVWRFQIDSLVLVQANECRKMPPPHPPLSSPSSFISLLPPEINCKLAYWRVSGFIHSFKAVIGAVLASQWFRSTWELCEYINSLLLIKIWLWPVCTSSKALHQIHFWSEHNLSIYIQSLNKLCKELYKITSYT